MLSDAETRLDRLRSLYEQYFQGIERIEPAVARKEVDRRIVQLRRGKPKNTALRFRFNSLLQRYTTYQNYWRRIVRQIEEGTYRRHLDRARSRKRPAPQPEPVEEGVSSVLKPAPAAVEADARVRGSLSPLARSSRPQGLSKGVRPAAPKVPQAPSVPSGVAAKGKRPPPPPPRATGAKSAGPDDQTMRRIYDEYVSTRKKHNLRTEHLRYESVAKKLTKMVPELQKKHRGKRIDFKVVVKDGKVGLKPVPR